ncbi:hypothetical protein GCM10028791_01490 [Echinicola sediminis]
MNDKLLYFILVSSVVFFACNREDAVPSNGNNQIVLNTDEASLNTRLSRENTGVVGITSEATAAIGGRISEEEEVAGNLPLELIAQVEAPVVDGNTLQATHVDIDGDYAYVTYNTIGEQYLGAVDIFDISNVLAPKIVSQAVFKEADLSAVDYVDGKLFIAAAVNVDADYGVEGPANLITVSTANGRFTSDFSFTTLKGYVGTDVNHTDNNIVSTSGVDGALALISRDNSSVVGEQEFADLRSVVFGEGKLFVLDGEQGVSALNPGTLAKEYGIALAPDYSGAKRTMDVHENLLIVSEGASGAGLYAVADGGKVKSISIPVVSDGLVTEEIVTNAVSTNVRHLFMANGSAGVSAVDLENDIASLGVLDLLGSSNFVKANDEYLFVASGLQGLQILRINLADEIDDVVCADLPAYTGNSWMNINSGQPQAYSGSLVLDGLNVNDSFTFCGSLSVKGWSNINSNGVFNMRGSLVIGQYNKDTGLQINDTMTIEGSLVIYGNLTLNSGAKLDFVGEGSSITVYGNVWNNGGTITGNYTDTEGKLK